MALELHLPDLPDVPISLGPVLTSTPSRAPPPLLWRLREVLSTYLPLLLMLLLALGTWWLVRNTPRAAAPRESAAPRSEPDYTMRNFVVERFDKAGKLKIRIQGDTMRHYPDTDRIVIDQARVRAIAPDGRATLARARQAISNADGSEVQLLGDAQVDSMGPRGEPIDFRGEFLHAFLATERLRSHLPVLVRHEGSEFRADGVDYDHLAGLLQLKGSMRAMLLPASGAATRASQTTTSTAEKRP
jgi:lipopolysaccharide export system protein LptC